MVMKKTFDVILLQHCYCPFYCRVTLSDCVLFPRTVLLCMILSGVFQELHELVNQEQNIVSQTSNALNQCCGTNSTFAGSAEAVECHRLLLISC